MNFKAVLLASSLALGATAAHAALIDFTDSNSYVISPANVATGAGVGTGVTWSLTGSGPLNNSEVGPGPIGPLAGINDGIGVNDDEISNINGRSERVTLKFSQQVTVIGLYFLDLFRSNDTTNGKRFSYEKAVVRIDGGPRILFKALLPFSEGVGFAAYEGLSLTGTRFVFSSLKTNDNVGYGDYALAGVRLAPVPLPAGILLLGGALLGLGALGRRRKIAA
jgi:hypothetical protein